MGMVFPPPSFFALPGVIPDLCSGVNMK